MHTNSPDSENETSAEAAGDTSRQPAKDRAAGAKAAAEQQGALGQHAGENAERGRAREVGAPDAPSFGGGSAGGPRRRLLLIALDGAAPELALGAWRGDLRALSMLTERGAYGRLHSSIPNTSTPAWASLFTSLDPGQLGIYAAAQRPNHSYAPPAALDSRALRAPRLWEILGRAGRQVGVVGAPLTSPATPVNGQMVGELDSAGQAAVYPRAFGEQVAQWLADGLAAAPATGGPIERAIAQSYARTEQRFRLARRMLARASYDCFVLFDDEIARVQRAIWHALDVTHLRYQPAHPLAGAISAFYRFVDDQIGELLELIDDTTAVAVLSAGGAQPLDGELALNDWLLAEGELRLHQPPRQPAALADSAVDWAATRAWAGDNGMIYLNMAGREPQGTVAPEAAEALLHNLGERLQGLRPPTGLPAAGPTFAAQRPGGLYAATLGVAPDLLVVGVQPGWRTNALVGHAQPWLTTHGAALDAAYESPRGMFVLYDPQNLGGGRTIDGATIYDITPTLLALFGIPAPAHTRGRVLAEAVV